MKTIAILYVIRALYLAELKHKSSALNMAVLDL